MNEDILQNILSCYEALQRGNGEIISKLESAIIELYNHSDSIPYFIHIIQNYSSNKFIIHQALISLSHTVRNSFNQFEMNNFPQDLAESLKSTILYLINTISDTSIFPSISNLAAFVFKSFPDPIHQFHELLEIFNQLLSNESSILRGLILWCDICYYLDPSIYPSFSEPLLNAILISFSNENEFFRETGVTSLMRIFFKDMDDTLLQRKPEFSEALQHLTNEALYRYSLSREVNKIFDLITFLFYFKPDSLNDFDINFYYFVIKQALASDIPPDVKFASLSYYSAIAELNSDILSTDLEEIMTNLIQALIKSCYNDREQFSPLYAPNFISNLSFNSDFAPELIDKFINMVAEASASYDAIKLQVSLSCLTALTDGAGEFFAERDNEMIQILLLSLGIGDPIIFNEACNLVISLSKVCCDFLFQSIDPLFNALFAHPDIPCSLMAMQSILHESGNPPPNPNDLISKFVQLMTTISPDAILPCISSSLEFLEPPCNDLFDAISGLLGQLLQQQNSLPQVFECFGYCARIAPEKMRTCVPQIIEVMTSCIGSNQFEIITNIAKSLNKIAQILPLTLQASPKFPELVQFFIDYLQNTKDDLEVDDDENDNNCCNTRSYVFTCICSFFSINPTPFMGMFDTICEKIISNLKSESDTLIGMAATAIEAASPGFALINPDPSISTNISKFVTQILKNITASVDMPEITINLLRALAFLSSYASKHLSNQAINKACSFFEEVYQLKIKSLATSKEIDEQFLPPIQFAFKNFVFSGCLEQTSNLSSLLGSLRTLAISKGRKQGMKSFAVLILSIISASLPIQQISEAQPDLIPFLCATALQGVSTPPKTNTAKPFNSYIMALNYLVGKFSSMFTAEQFNQIKNMCEAILSQGNQQLIYYPSVSLLWLQLITKLGCDGISPEIIEHALMNSDPSSDEIIEYSSAVAVLKKAGKINDDRIQKTAVIIFSSVDWVLKRISQEDLAFWTDVINALSDENILIIDDWNEDDLMQIKHKIHKE